MSHFARTAARGRPGLLLATLLASTLASAQTTGDWQVELVVFTYRDPPASVEFVLEPAPPGSWLRLEPLLPAAGSEGPGAESLLTRYPLLDDENLQLGALRQRLARSGEIRPLLHLGWRQDARAPRAAQPQDLPALSGSEGLSGTVRLYRRQSLHVELDLRLPATEAGADGADGGAGIYRLRETRIVRSGNLSYFDHPRFGAIVRVTPAATAPADGAQDGG